MRNVGLSAVVLAGGKSTRMGTDKAFIQFYGKPFISLITEELLKITDEVFVAIGPKSKDKFESALDFGSGKIQIINDSQYLENPVGGILSAFELSSHQYSFVIGCDSPLVKKELVEHLYLEALGYSAAVPAWDETDPMTCEPLCGVYNTLEMKSAIARAIVSGKTGCKHILLAMQGVKYIPVSELRRFDPTLVSLLNVNTPQDYKDMSFRCQVPF